MAELARRPRRTFRYVMVVLAVVVLIAGVWFITHIKDYQTDFVLKDAEFTQVRRGSLTIPITATGEISAAKLVEIRSRATGQYFFVWQFG